MKATFICPICQKSFTRIWTKYRATPIYCSRGCSNKKEYRMTQETKDKISRPYDKHPNFKGGEYKVKYADGHYRAMVNIPPDKRCLYPVDNHGCILRYRKVWIDAHHGEQLQSHEIIHHINGITTDDRLENLIKYPSSVEHAQYHGRLIAVNRQRDKFGRFV